MLKVKLKNNFKMNFEDLEVGTMFIWSDKFYNEQYLGMKVNVDLDENNCYILDLSDEIGTCFAPHEDFEIVRVIDNMELIER